VLGADRWVVAADVRAMRWRTVGRRSIVVHQLPLSERGEWRVALNNAGPETALDGTTALRAAGLRGFHDAIHLSVQVGSRARSSAGAVVHQLRRYSREDVLAGDLRRTHPHVAAVRAALWCRSDRAAATVMAMAVQQGLTTPDRLLAEALKVRRHRRRELIVLVAGDIADGARALSELDFTALCRARRLPEPSRQVVRHGPRGRVYLDAYWEELGLVVEVEGVHHDGPEHAVDDSLRQNDLSIARYTVLRVPILGLRTCPEEFMDQVEAAIGGAAGAGAATGGRGGLSLSIGSVASARA
jgi:very-short-patch-repair endonuclease